MMKYVYILAIFLCIYNINSQITKDGLTITSLEISNTKLNLSNPNSESTTWIIGIQTTQYDLSALTGAIYIIYERDYYYINNTFTPSYNYLNQTSTEAYITLCLAVSSLGYCGIQNGDESKDCIYNIYFYPPNGEIEFTGDEIKNAFPNSVISTIQNTKLPVVNNIQVSVHEKGYLVSFIFTVTFYGLGLQKIIFYVAVEGSDDDIGASVYYTETIDGLYYAEIIVPPGSIMNISMLQVTDTEYNEHTYYSDEIAKLFGIYNFSTPSASSDINYSDIFTVSANNDTDTTFYANVSSILTFDINLKSPDYSLVRVPENCVSYYQNSTNIQMYCYLFSYLPDSMYTDIHFSAASQFDIQDIDFKIIYENENEIEPQLLNITFSLSEFNGIEQFYVETNYTFSTPDSYLVDVYSYTNSKYGYTYIPLIGLANLVSGNMSAGVVSVSWLYDYSNDLSDLRVGLKNSIMDNYVKANGPSWIPVNWEKNDIQVKVVLDDTVFNQTNNSISATVPVTIETVTLTGDNLVDTLFKFSESQRKVISGSNNFNSLYTSQINSISEGNFVYQNYVTLEPYFLLLGTPIRGDYNLELYYLSTYSRGYKKLQLTNKCITVTLDPILPTIITDLSFSPSNIINSTHSNETIYINFQTKGDVINLAYIKFYTSDNLRFYVDAKNYYCFPRITDTIITNLQCEIPISIWSSGIYFYYIELSIRGTKVIVYNYQLQQSDFPSYIQINGPTDNGLVPTVTQFQTSFELNTNIITINYTINNESPYYLGYVEFRIFETTQVFLTGEEYLVQGVPNLNGSVEIDLCKLKGFSPKYQNIGIYISIPAPVGQATEFQFPYEVLKSMDSNQQNFPISIFGVCDYQPPRVVDFGILDLPSNIDTTNDDINITLFYDITDDVSGFFILGGTVRYNSSDSFYPETQFFVYDNSLVSGNERNGRYQQTFTIPQYTNGFYYFTVQFVIDRSYNTRNYTLTNTVLLASGKPYYFNAVSQLPNPSLPELQNVYCQYNNLYQSVNISISYKGNVSGAFIMLTTKFLNGNVQLHPSTTSSDIYEVNQFSDITSAPGLLYFSACLSSTSLTTQCYSFDQLGSLGFCNSFFNYNEFWNIPIDN